MTCLLLLPGMGRSESLRSDFASALGENIKTSIVAHPPAHAPDYVQLEAYIRERLPLEEPFVLMGESFSGPLAISIAGDPPRNLCGLILSFMFAKNPHPALVVLKPLIRWLPAVRSSKLASLFLLGNHATPALRQQLDAALAQVSPNVLRARLRAVINADVTCALQHIRVPTLYLRATRDRPVPDAASKLIAVLAPQTRIAPVEGPHMMLQTAPTVTAKIVANFIEENNL